MAIMYICEDCKKTRKGAGVSVSDKKFDKVCTTCHERKSCLRIDSSLSKSTGATKGTKRVRSTRKASADTNVEVKFPGEKKGFTPRQPRSSTSASTKKPVPRPRTKTESEKVTADYLQRLQKTATIRIVDTYLKKAIEEAKLGNSEVIVDISSLSEAQLKTVREELIHRGLEVTSISDKELNILW